MKTPSALTKENYKRFKTTYTLAVRNELDIFKFDGNEILTRYAKYLIQYLDEHGWSK